ncbi:MAG: Ig-like domain-containing protein [Bacteroidota bacterium]|jgi:uncharacterized protein (DUF2141 family)|nr:MAG: hypothetical protein DIU61_09395 [Bacteroidota bacterium]
MKYVPILIVLILASFSRCAQRTSPTGGPRDTIPPTLINVVPANQTTGYQGQRIVLTFDEDVRLNNPRQQLLITPSVGNDFEMTVRRKTVYLDLNATLRDSTTYTINFRESIQDNTEQNPAHNLILAYSTGTYIDSLSIEGSVYNLLKDTPLKAASVALYAHADTFNIFAHQPEYLTITDDHGYFRFQNLKAGTYYIYAFDDKNRNSIADARSESYGFLRDPIILTPDTSIFVRIPVINMDARPLRMISARPYNTYFNIRMSKMLDHYAIQTVEPTDSLRLRHVCGPDQANIQVYLPEVSFTDSIPFQFTAMDSIGNRLDTLLYAKRSPRPATPEAFKVTTQSVELAYPHYILTATIQANKPIQSITYDSILYVLDSAITVPLTAEDITFQGQSSLALRKTLPPEYFPEPTTAQNDNFRLAQPREQQHLINQLQLRKGAIISIENDSSAATQLKTDIKRPDNTGLIAVTVQTNEPNFLIQLLRKDYSIVQTARNQTSVDFRNLTPGDYLITYVSDRNANGKWDPGSFFRREEPEPIIFYHTDQGQSSVNIKANWELGPLLITYPEPVDNSRNLPRR